MNVNSFSTNFSQYNVRSSGLVTQQIWRFRGLGSYIRIRREDTPFLTTQEAPAHYVGFTMDTLQANSLLFLVGENTVSHNLAMPNYC